MNFQTSLFSNSWQNLHGNERKRSQSLDTRVSTQRDATYQLFGSSETSMKQPSSSPSNTEYLFSSEPSLDLVHSISPKDNSMFHYETKNTSQHQMKKYDYIQSESRLDRLNSNLSTMQTRGRANTIDVPPHVLRSSKKIEQLESDDLIFNMDEFDPNETQKTSSSYSNMPNNMTSFQSQMSSSFSTMQSGKGQVEMAQLSFHSGSFSSLSSFGSDKAIYGSSPSSHFDYPLTNHFTNSFGSPRQMPVTTTGGAFSQSMGSGFNSSNNSFSNGLLSSSLHSNGSTGSVHSVHGTQGMLHNQIQPQHSRIAHHSIPTPFHSPSSQNQLVSSITGAIHTQMPTMLENQQISSSPILGTPAHPQNMHHQKLSSWSEFTINNPQSTSTVSSPSNSAFSSNSIPVPPSSYSPSQTSESPPRPDSYNTREHPAGEYPSRTLFVRNISCSVDDEELRKLFTQFGEIRNMYTSCKQRGFVMISYFDIRHAKLAMAHLQHHTVQKRQIDVHYSIPKDNPSEKDANQGTLVVFNLDPSVTHEELIKHFGKYGEIKEIRETPHKTRHKFIEFFDVRHADIAMQALNKTEIRGRKIKIEASRPGGRPKHSQSGSTTYQAHSGAQSINSCSSSPSNQVTSSSSPSSGPNVHETTISSTAISNPTTSTPSTPRKGSSEQGKNRSRNQDSGRSKSKRDKEDDEKFKINMELVRNGSDKRTTLMIKNIPNKYSQKMLLTEIDKNFIGKYDFFYLPIDFKNKCNVGYAFINMVNPSAIIAFAKEFNLKKWGKFNSEKVCQLNYGRIQGKRNLVCHFQNSSLMEELVDCRPVFFDLDKSYYERDYSNC